jgi:transposase InsO family protein
MESISLIEHAWHLHQAGSSADEIAVIIHKHRATVFRWFQGIRLYGIREYLRRYEKAKKGRRQKRKTDPLTKARIYEIRREFKDCCGEKIQYWLHARFGQTIGLSTVYRVLAEKYELRPANVKNQRRGPVPEATKPRQVIQTDTVDFGELFAYTAVDIYTREACVVILDSLDSTAGAEALRLQFQYFNHADLIQRDGGPEFLKDWEALAPAYCTHIRTSRPYKKNEQAFIESFNRTLRKECLGWIKYKRRDLPEARARVSAFLQFYNTVRPHLSLQMQTPIMQLSHLR